MLVRLSRPRHSLTRHPSGTPGHSWELIWCVAGCLARGVRCLRLTPGRRVPCRATALSGPVLTTDGPQNGCRAAAAGPHFVRVCLCVCVSLQVPRRVRPSMFVSCSRVGRCRPRRQCGTGWPACYRTRPCLRRHRRLSRRRPPRRCRSAASAVDAPTPPPRP